MRPRRNVTEFQRSACLTGDTVFQGVRRATSAERGTTVDAPERRLRGLSETVLEKRLRWLDLLF